MDEYCAVAILDDDSNELVTENSKCPCCGERRMDWLVCQDDDTVKCATCGTVYTTRGDQPMRITIIEDTSDGSLYGDDSSSAEMQQVDREASEARYIELLTAAVHAAYPNAELEVLGEENGHIPGRAGNVELDGIEDASQYSQELEAIDEIRHAVWERCDWIVYK